jgi:TonB family protein
LIHFDFDDRYIDENIVGSAISRREGVIFSVVFHVLVLLALTLIPKLSIFQLSPEELERRRAELEERQREEQQQRFVFVQPRVDMRAISPPPRAELSDEDRRSQAPQVSPEPSNPLAFSRGNSSERVEAAAPETARGPETPQPEPVPPPPEPERQIARTLPPAETGLPRLSEQTRPRPQGQLGEALKNLQRYVQNETFNNPQGGANTPGATIQFDTKGVEFGPWLRRFVSQVRRNWFVPLAAYTLRGHVVLQFNIHKDGSITDLAIVQPSPIQSFNIAAMNAIMGSNPTEPLPPEYPSPQAFFTVTFYYNEDPGN